ncbi:MAG: bifunctional protein FolD [Edafosvirus sp.]|uniref:Bifunctional protein FolD n=1 Tax=Edafosvirus sp. TaxID=2487765 RepID=A0A3G4ZV71_9VIRU|nr:MAG: bifunctional protein FolD [Edafosvirus sp.]
MQIDKNLNGKKIADIALNELKQNINKLTNKLFLAVVQIGDNEASNMCIKLKLNKCKECGVESELFKLSENTTQDEILKVINELNNNKKITGIILQLPIHNKFNVLKIINAIDPKKDADGLNYVNMGYLFLGEPIIVPATAMAICNIIDYYKIDVSGKNVVIVGRSNLVAKPTAMILQQRNATVTMVHTKTTCIDDYTQKADILVVACGSSLFIKKNMIKENAIIIDVGINKHLGKTCGDVDYNDVYDKVSLITPVPGGIGPLTVMNMIKNVYNCYIQQN